MIPYNIGFIIQMDWNSKVALRLNLKKVIQWRQWQNNLNMHSSSGKQLNLSENDAMSESYQQSKTVTEDKKWSSKSILLASGSIRSNSKKF